MEAVESRWHARLASSTLEIANGVISSQAEEGRSNPERMGDQRSPSMVGGMP